MSTGRSPSASQMASMASSVRPPEKTASLAKSSLLAFVEERVAPLDGSPQGALPLGEVTCSSGKELQAAAKPL